MDGARATRLSFLALLALLMGLPLVAGLMQTFFGSTWGQVRFTGLGLSLWIALVATALSLFTAMGLAACFHRRARLLTWLSLPLLAVPHAAVAQALALLLAPSGVLMRLLSPWATGIERPPTHLLWDQHPDGWTLILVLVLKELPFFLLLLLTYSAALPLADWRRTGAGLGYGSTATWWHTVLPVLLPRLLIPILIVLVFALSVVDVAVLVGPSQIKTFAHSLHQAYSSGVSWGEILASATVLLILSLALFPLIWVLLQGIGKAQAFRPRSYIAPAAPIGGILGMGLFFLAYLSLLILPLQSLIQTSGRRTRFPDLWTGQWGFEAWGRALEQAEPTLPLTLTIAGLATLISLGLALGLLSSERYRPINDLWIMVPLFVPQFAFLSGGLFLGIRLDLIPQFALPMAVWFHGLFVFPYVFLVLAPAYRGLDPAYGQTAASLGLGPLARVWRVQLPLLFRPILFAAAWGMAVSFALYLPTFFAGAGRLETLLSEAVNQAGGRGDSVQAVWGLILLLVPFVFFALAASLVALQARNRAGLRGGL